MKKHAALIVSIGSCVLALACMLQLHHVSEAVSDFRFYMDSQLSQVNSNINDIYETVSTKLEEEANLLSRTEFDYGKLLVDGRTADVTCKIVPKVYAPETTTATLFCNEQAYPMAYKNGAYVATVSVPLFEESVFTHVTLEDAGTIRTQTLDQYISPRYEVLPSMYAQYNGRSSMITNGKKQGVLQQTGLVEVHMDGTDSFEIASATVLVLLDGKELDHLPIDLSSDGQQLYQSRAEKVGEVAAPESITEATQTESGTYRYDGNAYFGYFMDKTYTLSFESMVEIFVDVVDSNGLRYRMAADCYALDGEGNADMSKMDNFWLYVSGEPCAIYDADGTLLYTVDKSLFQ